MRADATPQLVDVRNHDAIVSSGQNAGYPEYDGELPAGRPHGAPLPGRQACLSERRTFRSGVYCNSRRAIAA
jgi:hypothetical protein